MADHHTPAQKAVLPQFIGARLAVHLQDGPGGAVEIIRRAAVFFSQRRRNVFEVGQVDLHLSLQGAERLHPLIAAGVPHHGHRQRLRQRLQDPGRELGGAHQIDIVGPLGNQLFEDLPQARGRDLLSKAPGADGAVLAESAPEGAAGEKHRAGAPGAADAGFLPEVQGRPGRLQPCTHAAEARLPGAVHAAAAGAEFTSHAFHTPSQYSRAICTGEKVPPVQSTMLTAQFFCTRRP